MKKHLSAFSYYGGKGSRLGWLLPLLPYTEYYCEPFGGSAAVLLNRPPCKIETYNDLESEVVNFFGMLRDQPEELTRLIMLTPFSRKEFEIAASKEDNLTTLERARRFYIRIRQGFGSKNKDKVSSGDWASAKRIDPRSLNGFYPNAADIMKIAARLRNVQIENRPALQVIQDYDHKKTLTYIDPPYDDETCDSLYKHQFKVSDYKQMFSVLEKLEGKVAVSGYGSDTLNTLFKGWHKTEIPVRVTVNNGNIKSQKRLRTEVVWSNYDPYKTRRLF